MVDVEECVESNEYAFVDMAMSQHTFFSSLLEYILLSEIVRAYWAMMRIALVKAIRLYFIH